MPKAQQTTEQKGNKANGSVSLENGAQTSQDNQTAQLLALIQDMRHEIAELKASRHAAMDQPKALALPEFQPVIDVENQRRIDIEPIFDKARNGRLRKLRDLRVVVSSTNPKSYQLGQRSYRNRKLSLVEFDLCQRPEARKLVSIAREFMNNLPSDGIQIDE